MFQFLLLTFFLAIFVSDRSFWNSKPKPPINSIHVTSIKLLIKSYRSNIICLDRAWPFRTLGSKRKVCRILKESCVSPIYNFRLPRKFVIKDVSFFYRMTIPQCRLWLWKLKDFKKIMSFLIFNSTSCVKILIHHNPKAYQF